ncbi:hypothetical protein [uncultured Albimonas sp.]|uniref:hypothetical protein n=1 Tax=uncultured Albimonas sp. TaxID=1331701 RepID=UPI0030EF21FA|tara:strand:+ start:4906 stop:5274 length:369 start_codon:yes stop_codon:yes gene_type:complete
MIRGALIGLLAVLLTLQGVALRAAPFVDAGEAAGGIRLHLCSGGVIDIGPDGAPRADAPTREEASHLGCLDCCLAPIALPASSLQAPARGDAPGRAGALPEAPRLDGHDAPLACARDPPDAS